jgi:ATP-dependent helicase/nuclease subunit B
LPQPLAEAQRATAIAQLEQVSRQVFARELEDNFEHRAWLRRWLVLVEPYIEWLIGHQAGWRFLAGERDGECRLADGRTLAGRMDRIDSGSEGALIIDYKTGSAPDQHAVDAGEAVQLPSYALLADSMPQAVEYLLFGKRNNRNAVWTSSQLEGETLAELSHAVLQRLDTVLAEIASGTPLPAWGDADTCKYCEMDGLCRKPAWPEP